MRSAAAHDAQRARLDHRAKMLPRRSIETRIVVVVAGDGAMRRLSEHLGHALVDHHGAVLLGVQEDDDPGEIATAIHASAEGRAVELVLVGPVGVTRPIADECLRRSKINGQRWRYVLDLLDGLRQRDREAMVRHAIRLVKGGA